MDGDTITDSREVKVPFVTSQRADFVFVFYLKNVLSTNFVKGQKKKKLNKGLFLCNFKEDH